MNQVFKYFIVIFTCLTKVAFSQTPDQKLKTYFTSIREEANALPPPDAFLPGLSKKYLVELQPYYRDTSELVRNCALNLTKAISDRKGNENLRLQTVQQLANALRYQYQSTLIVKHLQNFKISDFSVATKDTLALLIADLKKQDAGLIKLIGFVNIPRALPYLELSSSANNSAAIRWTSLISRTRMDDVRARKEVLQRIKKISVNDDVVYDLFPDLIYTRDKEVFSYLIEILNSDNKDCNSAGENVSKIPCAYRVMEMLAPVIKDYPLTLDASGDINTKDYVTALQTVRTWFKQHPNYTIITDTY